MTELELPRVGPDFEGPAYPNISPSSDVVGLLRDFYLWGANGRRPFHIARLRGFCAGSSSLSSTSSGHAVDLWVEDADGVTVFDSTLASYFSSRAWGSNYLLYEWRTSTTVCRALHYTGPGALEAVCDFAPESAVLDERTVEYKPARVESLIVSGQTLAGTVELIAGYNWKFDLTGITSGPGKKRVNRIVVSAVPGQGEGLAPGCTGELPLRFINGVGPDARGNLTLTGESCYSVRLPALAYDLDSYFYWHENYWIGGYWPTFYWPDRLTGGVFTPLASTLEWRNDCAECVSCDDYALVYLAIRRIYEKYVELGGRSDRLRGLLDQVTTRWNEAAECSASSPYQAALRRSGDCVDAAVSYCNKTTACVREAVLHLSMSNTGGQAGEQDPAIGKLFTGGGAGEPYTLGGEWPDFTAHIGSVDPGRAVRVRFRTCFEAGSTGAVSLSVHGTAGGVDLGNPLTVATMKG